MSLPQIYFPNMDDQKRLAEASKSGKVDEVKEIIRNKNILINFQDDYGRTSLMSAAIDGHTEVIKALLAADGIDVNLKDKLGRNTSLMLAVEKGHSEAVTTLLSVKGICVNIQNEEGYTALILAAWRGHFEIVKLLLEFEDIEVNKTMKWGNTALMKAAAGGHTEIARALLAVEGVVVNTQDRDGYTALMLAARWGHTDIVDALLAIDGIDVNLQTQANQTALHCAAEKQHNDLVYHMLKSGRHFDEHSLTAVTPLLVDAIIDCNYSNVCCVRYRVKWKDAVKKVSESEIKYFALNCKILDWEVLTAQGCAIWASITNFGEAKEVVKEYLQKFPDLVTAKDEHSRSIVNLADPNVADLILSITLWHGRYQLTEMRPDHMSATCFVFKATDEMDRDPFSGERTHKSIALKLLHSKDQYRREIEARDRNFNDDYIIEVVDKHLPSGYSTFEECPEYIDLLPEAATRGMLYRHEAESLFCLAMPLADRNLFTAIKQVRFAGVNMREVKHIFKQILTSVGHLHTQGIIHADLKPLNVLRLTGTWKLVDLDASCVLGHEAVGVKCSTAYMPPEVLFVHENPNTKMKSVEVLCAATNEALNIDMTLLTAHPSFDMWSLGCILYQLCSGSMLFQGNLDDNLSSDINDADNLWQLYSWSDDLKITKLSKVTDKLALNLLSRLLMREPLKRPTLIQALEHPFISGMEVARLFNEEAEFDAFISYRVDSDSDNAEILYNLLTAQGLNIFWDKKCLKPGVEWEKTLCEGLVNSRVFIPILSRLAINHPSYDSHNFSKLKTNSNCDNLYLEYRLAVEFKGLDMIEKVFPVFIGDFDNSTEEYKKYFSCQCHPNLPDVWVDSVEEKVRQHLESQALGTPLQPNCTVKSVVNAITACHGASVYGKKDSLFIEVANTIADMIRGIKQSSLKIGLDSINDMTIEDQFKDAKHKLNTKDTALKSAEAEIAQLRAQLANVTHSPIRSARSTRSRARTPTHLPHPHHEKDMNLRYRAHCPGLKIPIKDQPHNKADTIYYIHHQEVVEIRRTIEDGFHQLSNGMGWVYLNMAKVKWTPAEM